MKWAYWRNSIDFYCGMLLIVTAAFCLWLIADLDVGTSREMGPAFFPLIIAVILGGMGAIMMGRGLFMEGPAVGHIEIRPLFFILLSFVVFGVLIARAGLIVAICAQVAVAHFASPETKPVETLLFALGLSTFSTIVFVYLLGIPVSVFP